MTDAGGDRLVDFFNSFEREMEAFWDCWEGMEQARVVNEATAAARMAKAEECKHRWPQTERDVRRSAPDAELAAESLGVDYRDKQRNSLFTPVHDAQVVQREAFREVIGKCVRAARRKWLVPTAAADGAEARHKVPAAAPSPEALFTELKSLIEQYWQLEEAASGYGDPAALGYVSPQAAQRKLVLVRDRITTMIREVEAAAAKLGIAYEAVAHAPPIAGGRTFGINYFRAAYDPNHNQYELLKPHHTIDLLNECIGAARVRASAPPSTAPAPVTRPDVMGRKIFVGHGRSPVWRDLKDFLRDRLHLEVEEYNMEPTAGMATTERLGEMLGSSQFAFLLMTAEDEHADGERHARENVVHEVGLFQGRLGFRKAIVLLEKGCSEFSNIVGLGQIRFAPGDIRSVFEEVRRVLEREGVLVPVG